MTFKVFLFPQTRTFQHFRYESSWLKSALGNCRFLSLWTWPKVGWEKKHPMVFTSRWLQLRHRSQDNTHRKALSNEPLATEQDSIKVWTKHQNSIYIPSTEIWLTGSLPQCWPCFVSRLLHLPLAVLGFYWELIFCVLSLIYFVSA